MLPSLETPGVGPPEGTLELAALLLSLIGFGRRVRKQVLLARLSVLQQRKLRLLGIALGNSEIDVQFYQREMTNEIEAEHTAAIAIWLDELEELSEIDEELLRIRLNTETGYLSGLIAAWRAGSVTQGRLASRSQMYGAAVRPTYYQAVNATAISEGFELERNLLSPVDNCTGAGSCTQETGRGFVSIGTLIPIGNRVCLSNCMCRLEFIKVDSQENVIV